MDGDDTEKNLLNDTQDPILTPVMPWLTMRCFFGIVATCKVRAKLTTALYFLGHKISNFIYFATVQWCLCHARICGKNFRGNFRFLHITFAVSPTPSKVFPQVT